MRCLFVVDEIARFREVGAVLDSRDVAMIMVKDSDLAERIANTGRFDIVMVGANSVASDSMRYLQRRRARRCPVVAVTCECDLQRALVDAGADRVVLLPDNGDGLKRAFAMLVDDPARALPEGSRRGRLWQHFGL
jgi:DNA-binding response OmpR family regulator